MKIEEIRDLILRMEGFADGIKNGSAMMAKLILEKINEEEKSKKTGEENASN